MLSCVFQREPFLILVCKNGAWYSIFRWSLYPPLPCQLLTPPGRHILALLFVHLFRNMINIYLNLIIVQLYFHPVVSNPIALMPVLQ